MSALAAQLASSGRIRLARQAELVIAQAAGVSGTAGAAGRWMTPDGDRAITGVIATAQAAGRVEIELHLVLVWPPEPLEQVSEQLRRRLRRAAATAGLADRLGTMQITFHDVVAPDEPTDM